MPIVLAHALTQALDPLPLSLIVVGSLGLYLGAGTTTTRRVEIGEAATDTPPRDRAAGTEDLPRTWTPARIVGLVGLALIIALSVFGPSDASSNLTDEFTLTLLFGAVALSSIVLGGWWGHVDPMRGVDGLLRSAAGGAVGEDEPAARLTTAVAVGAMLIWAAIQLVLTLDVATWQIILALYVLLHVIGGARFGPRFVARTETLTVASDTLGLLRHPRALVDHPGGVRLRWLTATLIAWTLTDLALETALVTENGLSRDTRSLIGLTLLLGLTVGLARLIDAAGRSRGRSADLAPAFVAVAAGWAVAQYLPILIVDAQGLPIWLSDPFDSGWNLFGRAGTLIDIEPIPPALAATLQVIPFVLGHVAGLVIGQRRIAATVADRRQLSPASFGLQATVGLLLVTGLYLQLGGF